MTLAEAKRAGLLTSDEVATARALGISELPDFGPELQAKLNEIVNAVVRFESRVLWAGYGIEVVVDEMLPDFVVSVRGDDELAMNRATWNAIVNDDPGDTRYSAYDELIEILGDKRKWQEWKEGPVVRAIVKDGGSFAAAARRLRDEQKADEVDPLAELEARITALVTQAAELRMQPTSSVAATLGHRLGLLREEQAVLETRIAALRGVLDFAAIAIVDAASLPVRAS